MNLAALKKLNVSVSKRAVLLLVALAAGAGIVTGREKPTLEVVQPRAERPAERPAGPAPARAPQPELDLDLERLTRSETMAPQADPFAARSFAAPAREQVARAAPPAPSAPPLPFRYFGKVTQEGRTEVFVLRGEELISIAAGQKIGAEYRVEAIGEKSISFTYLPLKTRQALDLPGEG